MPYPRTDLSHDLSDRYAERGVAIQNNYADLEFIDLTVEVPRHEALPQQFHTVHLCFDATSAAMIAPVSSEPSTEILPHPHDFVSCDRSEGVRLPWFCVLAGWDDDGSASIRNGIMALARVISAVCGDAADLLFEWDLIEYYRKRRRVADATSGELNGSDLHHFLVDPEVNFPPDPPFGTAMLARIPFTLTLTLMPVLSIRRCKGTFKLLYGKFKAKVFWWRDNVL